MLVPNKYEILTGGLIALGLIAVVFMFLRCLIILARDAHWIE
jgi:hypothetical protein